MIEEAGNISNGRSSIMGLRLDVDGDLGSQTRSAQQQHGLLATGEVDQVTETALIQRALEEIRKQSLFPKIGVMDNKTFEEIKRFQSENGFEPDGLVGRRTSKAMVSELTRTLPSVPEGIKRGCAQFRCPDIQARLRRIKPLVPLLNRHRGDIPMYLLGWIAHESGGRLDVVTRLDERGYFQIHPDESRTLVIDHARLSVDPEYSIAQDIALVRHRASGASRLGFASGTDLYWRVAKLLHWLPAGVNAIVSLMKKQGFKPTSWEQFKQFTMDHRKEVLEALERKYEKKNLVDTGWDPARGIANAEKGILLRQGAGERARCPVKRRTSDSPMIIDCHCHAGKGDGLSGPWDTAAPLEKYLRRAGQAGMALPCRE